MKDLVKKKVKGSDSKKSTKITVSCQNSNGKVVNKWVTVGSRRVVRRVAHQEFVITPVLNDASLVGYAVQKGGAPELYRPVMIQGDGGKKNRFIRRRAPVVNREVVYNTSMLPSGMYICSSCNNFVESGHSCTDS